MIARCHGSCIVRHLEFNQWGRNRCHVSGMGCMMKKLNSKGLATAEWMAWGRSLSKSMRRPKSLSGSLWTGGELITKVRWNGVHSNKLDGTKQRSKWNGTERKQNEKIKLKVGYKLMDEMAGINEIVSTFRRLMKNHQNWNDVVFSTSNARQYNVVKKMSGSVISGSVTPSSVMSRNVMSCRAMSRKRMLGSITSSGKCRALRSQAM